MKYFDIHNHLFGRLPDKYVKSGVAGAVVNATCEDEWATVVDLVRTQDSIFGAVGIHPWKVERLKVGWNERLRQVLIVNPDLMVGEIGLDKYKQDIDLQESVFVQQLLIAHDLMRAVFIHCVGAWDRMLHILKKHSDKLPPVLVFHAFSGNAKILEQLINGYNAYISYSPLVITHDSEKIRKTILATPLNRLLIESDDEEVSQILQVADFIATIRQEEKTELLNQIYKNSQLVIKNGQTAQN